MNNNQILRKDHFIELNESMPIKDKILWAEQKIKEFIKWCEEKEYKEILISFSGGKDSTVLFDLVVNVHNKIKSKIFLVPAYAIEITFPSTIKFIREVTNNYQQKSKFIKDPLFVKPKKAWVEILHSKGYPIYSKQISTMLNRLKRSKTKNILTRVAFGIEPSARYKLSYYRLFLLDSEMTNYHDELNNKIEYFFSEKCCDFVKGGLKHDKRPSFVGTMANESLFRKQSWIKHGCNVFNKTHPMSRPLSLWNSNDIWEYIKIKKLNVNEAYGYDSSKHNIDELRFSRLGCTSCPLGSQIEEIVANKFSIKDELCKEYKYQNRFEKLLQYSEKLYETQVWKTGMYNILADMNIKIRNDKKYMDYYSKRRKRIDEWYQNISKNLLRVMIQVEQSENNIKKKNKKDIWKYSYHDFELAFKHYNVPFNFSVSEIEKIRKKEFEKRYKNGK